MPFLEDLEKSPSQSPVNAELNKLDGMISTEQACIDGLYMEIGKKHFELNAQNPTAEFLGLFSQINDCQNKINQYAAEIRELKGLKVCPNCLAELAIDLPFCSQCGAKQEIPVQTKKFCTNCGAIVTDDSAFCVNCGAKIEPNEPVIKKICANCGNDIGDAPFCSNCGTKYDADQQSAAPVAAPIPVATPIPTPAPTSAPIPTPGFIAPVVPIQNIEPEAVAPVETSQFEKLEDVAPVETEQFEKLEDAAPVETEQFEEPEVATPVEPAQNLEPTPAANLCPNCNALLEDDSKFCTICGINLADFVATAAPNVEPEQVVIDEPVAVTETAVFAEPTMEVPAEPIVNRCANCGSPLEDGSSFCTTCGAKVLGNLQPAPMPVAEPVPNTCPNCNAILEDDAKFCTTCGFKL